LAENLVHHTGNWITEHPYASAGIAVGTLVVVWYLMSGSSTPAAAVSTSSDSAAASTLAAQIAANTSTTNAQIAANTSTTNATTAAQVTNNQTAAAQAVSLAQIQENRDAAIATAAATTSTAQYNASAEIANSNASIINNYTNAGAAEQLSNNATLASEFSALAGVLNTYFSQASKGTGVFSNVGESYSASASSSTNSSVAYSVAGTPAVAAVQGISPASYIYQALTGIWNAIPYGTVSSGSAATPASSSTISSGASYSANQASYVPVANPNLSGTTSNLLSGFGGLLAGLGKGLQAPVTSTLSATNLLSALSINTSAVNGWSNHA